MLKFGYVQPLGHKIAHRLAFLPEATLELQLLHDYL